MFKSIETPLRKERKSFSSQKKRNNPRFLVEREKQWNNRIVAGEQIIQETNQGKTMSFQRNRNKQMFPEISKTTQIVQRYIQMHQEQIQQESKADIDHRTYEIKLQQAKSLWKVYSVPDIHQQVILQLLSQPNSYPLQILDEEIKLLDSKLSAIQHCVYALTAREKCFRVLIAFVNRTPDSGNDEFRLKCLELIDHYRQLSLMAFESIIKWQQYIEDKSEGWKIQFKTDDGLNYCEKIQKDYLNLKSTTLSITFNFSDNQDPFLISLLNNHPNQNQSSQKHLIQRIRRAEAELICQLSQNQQKSQTFLDSQAITESIIQKELQTDGTNYLNKQSD